MRFEEVFKEVLLEYLHQSGVPDAVEVTTWEETSEVVQGLGWASSWSETLYRVNIWYRTASGSIGAFVYRGTFAALLQDLVEIGDRMEVDNRSEDPGC